MKLLKTLAMAIELQPWADKLVNQALGRPDGERLMLISAGLEFIQLAVRHTIPSWYGRSSFHSIRREA